MKAGLVKRARIVLLAAYVVTNEEIAARVGASRTAVIQWRNRYQAGGLAGLEDHDRSGRPREVDHAAVGTATLTPPPKKFAVTHWSSRLVCHTRSPPLIANAAAHIGVPNCIRDGIMTSDPWPQDRPPRTPA